MRVRELNEVCIYIRHTHIKLSAEHINEKKWASWGRYTEKKHRESKKADKLNQIDKHSIKALTSRKNIAHNKRTYENVKNKLHNYNLHCKAIKWRQKWRV